MCDCVHDCVSYHVFGNHNSYDMKPEGEGYDQGYYGEDEGNMPEGEGEDMMSPPGHHLDSQYCSSAEEFAAGNCRGCEKLCMSGSRYSEDIGLNMACKASCCMSNDCTDGMGGESEDDKPEMSSGMKPEGEDEGDKSDMGMDMPMCIRKCTMRHKYYPEGEGEMGEGDTEGPMGGM